MSTKSPSCNPSPWGELQEVLFAFTACRLTGRETDQLEDLAQASLAAIHRSCPPLRYRPKRSYVKSRALLSILGYPDGWVGVAVQNGGRRWRRRSRQKTSQSPSHGWSCGGQQGSSVA